jgi:uridine kinase
MNPEVLKEYCEKICAKPRCVYCLKEFASKKGLKIHINNNSCTVLKDIEAQKVFDDNIAAIVDKRVISALSEQMEMMADKVATQVASQMNNRFASVDQQLKQINKVRPHVQNIINNDNKNLNVMCIGPKDNLLDILSSREGLHLALTYIKDSALGRVAADCRILERAYLPPGVRPAIMYRNQSKNQLVYYDEENERQIETNPSVLAKKLADILQRSYLKGMDTFKTDLCGEKRRGLPTKQSQKDIPEVDAYDINLMNEHIHELQNEKYQKSLLKSMKIPFEKELQDEYFE